MKKDTLQKLYKKESEIEMDTNFVVNLRKRLGNQMEIVDDQAKTLDMIRNRSTPNSNQNAQIIFSGRTWLAFLMLLIFVLGGIVFYNFYVGNLSNIEDKSVQADDKITITASQAKEIFQQKINATDDKTKVYYVRTLEKEPYNPGLRIQNEFIVDTWIDQQTGSYKKVTRLNERIYSIEVSNLGGYWKYTADNKLLEETIYPTPLQTSVQTSSLLDLLEMIINTDDFTFRKVDNDRNLFFTTINVDDFQKRDYFFDRSSYDLKRIDVSVRQNKNSEYKNTQTIEVLEQSFTQREMVDIAEVFNLDKKSLGDFILVAKQPTPSVTVTPDLATKKLKVYFLSMTKFNEYGQSEYLSERYRYTARVDVATFLLEELIKGPNDSEKNEGEKLKGLINLSEESNCGGKDFKISISGGVAKINWCRTIDLVSLGDSQSLALFDSIEKTLTQFPTVQKVKMYDRDGNCLSDAVSGLDRCE